MGSAFQTFTPLGKGSLFAPEDCVFNSFSPHTSPCKIFSLRKKMHQKLKIILFNFYAPMK